VREIKEKGELLERENSQYDRFSDNPEKEIMGRDVCVSGVGMLLSSSFRGMKEREKTHSEE
jgi:hypothetical protein